MKKLTIDIGNVTVPLLDYAIGGTAILGIRDSGKTVTAKGIAEQLLDHHIPIIVFDAVGKWRWMKVPGNTKRKKGYEIVVAGGRAHDLPLTPHSVAEIVRSAVKERIPLIIDLYDPKLSKADWRRIVQTAIRIIHYENDGGPLHVFLEEAAEYVPQKVIDGETYAEVEKFARMGGNASVGITLINQRSQEVNKAVLDLCTTLILGQQVGSRAIEAVEKWVDRLDPEIADEVTTSLPRLKSGEAWVWTRQTPDHPSREKLPMCRSLHPDRRTPEVVLKAAPKVSAAAFVNRMAAAIPKVIEESKANDPAELRREVAKLKQELAKKPKAETAKPEIKEVPVLTDKERSRLEKLIGSFDKLYASVEGHLVALDKLGAVTNELKPEIRFIKEKLNPLAALSPIAPLLLPYKKAKVLSPFKTYEGVSVLKMPSKPKPVIITDSNDDNGEIKLTKCARVLLATLIQHGPSTKRKLSLASTYSIKSSGFANALSDLRGVGAIEGKDVLKATEDGITMIGELEPLPTGEALRNRWISQLGKCPSALLEILIGGHPQFFSREELAAQSGYSETSSGFVNSLSELRGLELIVDGPDKSVKAADELFAND